MKTEKFTSARACVLLAAKIMYITRYRSPQIFEPEDSGLLFRAARSCGVDGDDDRWNFIITEFAKIRARAIIIAAMRRYIAMVWRNSRAFEKLYVIPEFIISRAYRAPHFNIIPISVYIYIYIENWLWDRGF